MAYSTRSRTGHTPRKPDLPGMVETPFRSRHGRKSFAPDESVEELTSPDTNESSTETKPSRNGSVKKTKTTRKSAGSAATDLKFDDSGEYEFGGPIGVIFIMTGFPILMYYMWIGATYYDGNFPWPTKGQTLLDFTKYLASLAYVGAFPSLKAWAIYWIFFVFEAILYVYMPGGVYVEGKPLPHEGGKKLQYYCSGVPSFYFTIAIAAALHSSGLFPLYTLMDEFGPLMSVAIISGIVISFIAYFSAIHRGAQHRMSGNAIYDFFMGAELNPRMLEWLDFKMFFEVRIPWFILFFVTLGACARQWEQYGYVSGELAFLLMAHWLYANACCKGEELIPPTWDMYYEKWGFMLIFWNLAGVPLSYLHCTVYLANHDPTVYRWPRPFLAFLFVTYLFAYWVWDTAGSQKNTFRATQRGTVPQRRAFPQLPYRVIKNPETIPVPGGDPLLCDGWYKYARKVHYTADVWFAICWALVTGFGSPFPWFYPVFFCIMIAHRAQRDIHRCRIRYGDAWKEYEKRVPYLFIPYVL